MENYASVSTDNTLSWKNHIDMIAPKLSQVCYTVRRAKPYLSWDALKMIYYIFFHSIMTYGLIF